jgi:cytochrome c peroxidase
MKVMRFRMLLLPLVVILVSSAYAETDADLLQRAKKMFEPIPTSPPLLEGNPLTAERIDLGKILFFDPRLSASALISCNTCHNLGMGGADYQETSTGHGWQRGPRNAPTVLNSVFNIAQFWDGRAEDLMEQAKGPVQASVEMNNTPEMAIRTLKSMPDYGKMFKKAFPGADDPVTFDNMARAIEAFEATLLTPDSPFDRFLKGNQKALNAAEKEGLRLFMDKHCAACHGGLNMGGQDYYPFGVVKKPAEGIRPTADKGRYGVTNTWSDEYVFKAPSLRNIALTPPYFHSGKVWDLKEAVAIMGAVQLGVKYTDADVSMIVTFLRSTTGLQPKVEYPILPAPTGNTPKPKLD